MQKNVNNKQIKRIELNEKQLTALNLNKLRHNWTEQEFRRLL
jgi:hypothetical protein